jgi:transcriptional regulator with XRE-family HTH domain
MPRPDVNPEATFARRLRALREESGLTQRQLADQVTAAGYRMHQTTIAKIESLERPVALGEAVVLARVIGVSLPGLLDELPVGDDERALMSILTQRANCETKLAKLTSDLARARMAAAAAEEDVSRIAGALAETQKELDRLTVQAEHLAYANNPDATPAQVANLISRSGR